MSINQGMIMNTEEDDKDGLEYRWSTYCVPMITAHPMFCILQAGSKRVQNYYY